MKILLSNDDGIYSMGIFALAKSLSELGEVYIVAPEQEQSATGHAITIHQPLRCRKINFFDTGINAWWVNGTPADCIKLGIESLLGFRPDYVVSGINSGENLGTDIIYSGTVSAAIEGALFDIPSIAFSYANPYEKDFSKAAALSKGLFQQIINYPFPVGNILNINIPKINDYADIKGMKTTKMGVKKYKNNFEERKDPRGDTYYWLAGELVKDVLEEEDTDIFAIRNNFISITPILLDLTNYNKIQHIVDWKLEL